jgi:translation elongation factor EF-Tu-like GTPase
MKSKLAALICIATINLLPCGANAAKPKIVTYPATKSLPASITLLKRNGDVGRSTPFFTRYRPQHRFSGGKQDITCSIEVLKPKEGVNPGETAEIMINCAKEFKVIEGQPNFTVFEGGRKVAEGKLHK